MPRVTVKPSKVVTLGPARTSVPKVARGGAPRAGKKNALAALFGRKRPRPSVSSVPTRTQAL